MQTKNKPVHEVRLGSIKAAIWKNETEKGGVRFNVSLTRLYKDGEEWKQTDYFGRDDLLLVAKVADLTHTWICDQGYEKAPEREGANPGSWRASSAAARSSGNEKFPG